METLEGREFKLVDTSWMELILDERIEGWVVLGIITCVRLVFLGRNKKGERKLAKLSGRKRGEATKDPPFADGSAILRRVPPFE